jgi:hypothetical protein
MDTLSIRAHTHILTPPLTRPLSHSLGLLCCVVLYCARSIGAASGELGALAMYQMDKQMRAEDKRNRMRKRNQAEHKLRIQFEKAPAAGAPAAGAAAAGGSSSAAAAADKKTDVKSDGKASADGKDSGSAAAAKLGPGEKKALPQARSAASARKGGPAEPSIDSKTAMHFRGQFQSTAASVAAAAAAEKDAANGQHGADKGGGDEKDAASAAAADLDEESLFERVKVDFAPVYQYLHISEALHQVDSFKDLYKSRRRVQCMAALEMPPARQGVDFISVRTVRCGAVCFSLCR